MKLKFLIIGLLFFQYSFTMQDLTGLEDTQKIACELLLDSGDDQSNEDLYLDCFKEFIHIFPTDEFGDPQQFLKDTLTFLKNIIEKNQNRKINVFFSLSDELCLQQEPGIHIQLELIAGTDEAEQKRWDIMRSKIITLIKENVDAVSTVPFVQGLINIVPDVISKVSHENLFKDDSCGNRFKFNFDLC